jgi:hypothetical protein
MVHRKSTKAQSSDKDDLDGFFSVEPLCLRAFVVNAGFAVRKRTAGDEAGEW